MGKLTLKSIFITEMLLCQSKEIFPQTAKCRSEGPLLSEIFQESCRHVGVYFL